MLLFLKVFLSQSHQLDIKLDTNFLVNKIPTPSLMASFTKQGKLAREPNSKTAPMGVEISAGDLLTMRKLKNATSHLHVDQCNIPSTAQISIVANKE